MTYALIAFLIPLVTGALVQSKAKQAEVIGDFQILRYGTAARGFVWLLWLFSFVMIWLAVVQAKPEVRLNNFLGISVILVLIIPLHLEFFLVKIAFNRDKIITFSPWRKNRTIPWNDIVSYKYSPAFQWYVILTRKHGNIRIHDYISGGPTLISALVERNISTR